MAIKRILTFLNVHVPHCSVRPEGPFVEWTLDAVLAVLPG